MVVQVLKKYLLALKWAISGLKRGQDEVLGHFLGHYALVFAGFAYYDSEVLYPVADGDQSAEKEFAGPKMGHLGLNLGLKRSFVSFLDIH